MDSNIAGSHSGFSGLQVGILGLQDAGSWAADILAAMEAAITPVDTFFHPMLTDEDACFAA